MRNVITRNPHTYYVHTSSIITQHSNEGIKAKSAILQSKVQGHRIPLALIPILYLVE